MTDSKPRPEWLYRSETPPPAPDPFPNEPDLGKAWQRLQVLHTPDRRVDAEDYRWIVDWLAALERLFLDRGDLEPYYEECFAPENSDAARSPAKLTSQVAHVATIQAQFMEEVYYTLSLNRHGNAVDNRGWMNLFRRWGRSPNFNARLDQIRSTLTMEFLIFYDYYLRHYRCRIDEDPIPHPWDSAERRRDPRGPDALPERTGGDPDPDCLKDQPASNRDRRRRLKVPEPAELPGVYLDSGVREAGSKPEGMEEAIHPQASGRSDATKPPAQAPSADRAPQPPKDSPGGSGGRTPND